MIGESFADSGGKLGGHRLERFSCSCQRILPGRAFALGFGGMQVREFYLSLGTSVVGLSEVDDWQLYI